MDSKPQHRILSEVWKNPWVTAEGLKTSLELAIATVHEGIMHKSGGYLPPEPWKKLSYLAGQ